MFWNAVCASHGTPTRLSVSIITRISKVRKLRHSDSQGSMLVRSRAGALTQDARLTSHVPKDHAQLSLRIKRPVVHADTGPRSYMHVFNSSSKCELTAGKAVRTVARLRPCRPFRDAAACARARVLLRARTLSRHFVPSGCDNAVVQMFHLLRIRHACPSGPGQSRPRGQWRTPLHGLHLSRKTALSLNSLVLAPAQSRLSS